MPRTKTNNRIYHQLMELVKKNGGRLEVTNPDMVTLIGGEHRAATQFSAIRRYEKLTVNAVRTGRKVVAYEIPVYQTLATGEPKVEGLRIEGFREALDTLLGPEVVAK